MNTLLNVAESYFCKHILEENVFSPYHFAEEYGLDNFRLNCESKLEKELGALCKERDFKHVSFETIDKILARDSASAQVHDIFQYCGKRNAMWDMERYRENRNSMENG